MNRTEYIEALRKAHEIYTANYGNWANEEQGKTYRELSETYLRVIGFNTTK